MSQFSGNSEWQTGVKSSSKSSLCTLAQALAGSKLVPFFNVCNIYKYGVCSLADGTVCLPVGQPASGQTILRVKEGKTFMVVKILHSLGLCNPTSQYVARRASYTPHAANLLDPSMSYPDRDKPLLIDRNGRAAFPRVIDITLNEALPSGPNKSYNVAYTECGTHDFSPATSEPPGSILTTMTVNEYLSLDGAHFSSSNSGRMSGTKISYVTEPSQHCAMTTRMDARTINPGNGQLAVRPNSTTVMCLSYKVCGLDLKKQAECFNSNGVLMAVW
ncbi:hypothetical protein V8E52_001856 [Russula decolorans]